MTVGYALAYFITTVHEWQDLLVPAAIVVIECGLFWLIGHLEPEERYTPVVFWFCWAIALFFAAIYHESEPTVGPYLFLFSGSAALGLMLGKRWYTEFGDIFWPVIGVSLFMMIHNQARISELGIGPIIVSIILAILFGLLTIPVRFAASTIGGIVWVVLLTLSVLTGNAAGIAWDSLLGFYGMLIVRTFDLSHGKVT